jgi:putative Mn2+ efflux pump MntP
MVRSIAVKLTIASMALFLLILLSLHLLEPEFDPTWRFISEYALGDFGWLMSLDFMLAGIGSLSYIVASWDECKNVTGRIGQVLLGISALGMVIAALFTTDPITTPADEMTKSGNLHALGGQLNVTPLAVLFLSLSIRKHIGWKPVRLPLYVTAVLTLLMMAAFAASIGAARGEFGPGVYAGLFGRLLMIGFGTWILIAGCRMLRTQPNQAFTNGRATAVTGNEA